MVPQLRTGSRFNPRLLVLGVLGSVALTAQLGCGKRPEPLPLTEPRAAPTSANAIPAGPVTGRVAGKPFALKGARYSMDIRPGHEKTDIVLTDIETKDPCDDLGPSRATSVWVRWTGIGVPPEGTVQISAKEPGQWEAHYERYDREWMGNGNSSALVSLRSPRVDRKLEGDLSVCFGDGADSCVAGNFVARYCPVRMDAPVRGASAVEPLPSAAAEENPPPG